MSNLSNLRGVLTEVDSALNDYKDDKSRHGEVVLRLRACQSAIQIHTLEFLRQRFIDMRKVEKLNAITDKSVQ